MSELSTLIPGHIAGCARYTAERLTTAKQREQARNRTHIVAQQAAMKQRRANILAVLADGKGHSAAEISERVGLCLETTNLHLKTLKRDGKIDFAGQYPRLWKVACHA